LFLIFGAVIGRKVRWVRWLHIAALTLSVYQQLAGWICPITHLEVWLRRKEGWGYTGSFIKHYVENLVYLDVPRMAVFIGTVVVIGVTGVVYLKFRTGIDKRF
jgi:hypothetical protein